MTACECLDSSQSSGALTFMTLNSSTSATFMRSRTETSLPRTFPSRARRLRWVRLASLAIILVSLVLLARLLPVDRVVALLSTRVEQLGVWGPSAFAGTYVLAAILFVPGSTLTLAAGAVFGLIVGTIVVSVASTAAAVISFLIGRHVARDAVHRWAARNPRFAAIDRAIGQQGWKIIALLRLSPAVPFSLGNYLFGITSIRFWPYVLTSWRAMLPGTFMYVYLGYAGRAGLAAAAGCSGSRSPGQWVMLVVGLVATVAVTVYVTRLARKAVRENAVLSDGSETPRADGSAPRPSGVVGTIATAVLALLLVACIAYAYTPPGRITGLFGPPAVTMRDTYAEKPGGAPFDHSAFDVDSSQATMWRTSHACMTGTRRTFKQTDGSIPAFAARYSPALKRALDDGRQPTVRYLDYDWSLNRQKGAPRSPPP